MQECFPRSQLLCWDEKRGAQGSRHRWVASQARGLPGALLGPSAVIGRVGNLRLLIYGVSPFFWISRLSFQILEKPKPMKCNRLPRMGQLGIVVAQTLTGIMQFVSGNTQTHAASGRCKSAQCQGK